ncbi:acetyltransferase [Salinimicrobium flavum]|uniref:Acetyltransferase n=1 Tax=Salinimicrobium flavum TaxID=1737065 RepID=A0ABW5J0C4_9FLAO
MNLYGASGHAKVVIDIIHSRMEEIHYVLDDNPAITGLYDYPVISSFGPEVLRRGTLVTIGDNEIRKKVVDRLDGPIFKAIYHAAAAVDPTVEFGEGTVVMANASINADTIIGKNCIINTGATVEHDCVLGNYVHISPNAALAGGVVVGEGSHIGIGAVVIPGIKIGKWATVGAGAVVIEDVPDNATVVGNPGKIIKYKNEENEQR